jgi:hypothetical protein
MVKEKSDGITRVYQGRVHEVSVPQDGQWRAVPDGLRMLWGHHEVFQSAVNYYLLVLIGLATDPQSEIGRLGPQLTACWNDFTRNGEARRGMRHSLAAFIGDFSTWESAVESLIDTSASTAEVRQLALELLLSRCTGDSGIQQNGRGYFPRFCQPDWSGTWDYAASWLDSGDRGRELGRVLHDATTTTEELCRWAARMELAWAGVKCFENRSAPSKAEVIRRINSAIDEWAQELESKGDGETAESVRELGNGVDSLPDAVTQMGQPRGGGGNARPRASAAILFKCFPCEVTRRLLATFVKPTATPKQTKARSPRTPASGRGDLDSMCRALGNDPVALVRGGQGRVFPAFTGLPSWNPEGNWAVFSQFDILAFKEALKSLNQTKQKQSERDEKRRGLEADLHWLLDGIRKSKRAADQDDDPLCTLHGDPRAERLRVLLEEELAVANELSEGREIEYMLRGRTLRGARELFEKWNVRLGQRQQDPHVATVAELIGICDEHQNRHRDDMGSATLFRALARVENWDIWRDPSGEECKTIEVHGWSTDVLFDYARMLELKEDVTELQRPVRFTPADPERSPRLYMASDDRTRWLPASEKASGLAAELRVARRVDAQWQVQNIRIRLTAPRLMRDGLADDSSAWIPPMLVPFGGTGGHVDPQKPRALQLMPKTGTGGLRILANLPVTFSVDSVKQAIGVTDFWSESQFKRVEDTKAHLLWPETSALSKKKQPADWWNTVRAWSVLSVDLGQRTAGAFARLSVMPGQSETPGRIRLGVTGTTVWSAKPQKVGLLRLPEEGELV